MHPIFIIPFAFVVFASERLWLQLITYPMSAASHWFHPSERVQTDSVRGAFKYSGSRGALSVSNTLYCAGLFWASVGNLSSRLDAKSSWCRQRISRVPERRGFPGGFCNRFRHGMFKPRPFYKVLQVSGETVSLSNGEDALRGESASVASLLQPSRHCQLPREPRVPTDADNGISPLLCGSHTK